jgi:hypothetical protein
MLNVNVRNVVAPNAEHLRFEKWRCLHFIFSVRQDGEEKVKVTNKASDLKLGHEAASASASASKRKQEKWNELSAIPGADVTDLFFSFDR